MPIFSPSKLKHLSGANVMHCRDNLPVTIPEVWSYQRDCAKPTTPLSAYYLLEARTYTPPSKAHKRRILLKRDRPLFTRPPKLAPIVQTERTYHNSAAQLGREVAQIARGATLIERHYIRSSEPVRSPSVNSSLPQGSPLHAAPSDAWPTLQQIEARQAALAADFAAERARVDAVKG